MCELFSELLSHQQASVLEHFKLRNLLLRIHVQLNGYSIASDDTAHFDLYLYDRHFCSVTLAFDRSE